MIGPAFGDRTPATGVATGPSVHQRLPSGQALHRKLGTPSRLSNLASIEQLQGDFRVVEASQISVYGMSRCATHVTGTASYSTTGVQISHVPHTYRSLLAFAQSKLTRTRALLERVFNKDKP